MKQTKVFTLPLHGSVLSYSPYYSNGNHKDALRSPPPSSGGSGDSREYRRHSLPPVHHHHNNRRKVRSSGQVDDERRMGRQTSTTSTTRPTAAAASHRTSGGLLQQASTIARHHSSPFFVPRSSIESSESSSSSSTAALSGQTVNSSNVRLLLSSPSFFQSRSGDHSGGSAHFYARHHSNSPLPRSNRKCNDRLFLLLLLVALSISGFSLSDVVNRKRVNAALVLNGHDDWGNVCGQANEPIEGAIWSGQNMTLRRFMLLRLGRNHTVNSICIENCAFNDYFKTAFNRCLPKPLLLRPMFQVFNVTKGFFDHVLMDTLQCWDEVIHLCLVSVFLSFALLILLRFFVGFIIWLIIFALGALLSLFSFYFWSNWALERNRFSATLLVEQRLRSAFDDYGERSSESWLLLALIGSSLTLLFVAAILWMRKSIQFVSLLFREAGRATSSMPILLLLPFMTLAALLLAALYLVVSTVYMEADMHPLVQTNSTLVRFELDETSQYIKWYNLALFVWMAHLIYACQHFIIASSVARWYFLKERKACCAPVLRSVYELFRFHLGSLAFGSLMITGVKLFGILLKKLQSMLQSHEHSNTVWSRFVRLVIWLIEKLVIYINKNAYILIAIYGSSFGQSAKGAFRLILCHSFRLAVINTLGDFLLFIGKLVIVCITFLVGVEQIRDKQEKLNYAWGPLLLPVIFAYFVAHCFLTVYEMAIDTLFVCFCETNGPEQAEHQWATSKLATKPEVRK